MLILSVSRLNAPCLNTANALAVTRAIVGYKQEESDVLLVSMPFHVPTPVTDMT